MSPSPRFDARTPPPTTPPTDGSGVSRPWRPRPLRSAANGYTLRPLPLGFQVWLRYGYDDGTPSTITRGPWWALTRAGARRKAGRIIARQRRRDEREARTEEYSL